MIQILVENDTAPGSKTDPDRIFEAGYRGEGSLEMSSHGHGFGLFSARHTLRAVGGNIRVNSTEGNSLSRSTCCLRSRPTNDETGLMRTNGDGGTCNQWSLQRRRN